VLWDPQGTKTISAKTQRSKLDFNVFEGRNVRGVPSHTLSQGKVVYADGDLRATQGAGRYVKRPAFAPLFDALRRQSALHAPHAVVRDLSRTA